MLVLPENNATGAVILSNKLRQYVAGKKFRYKDHEFSITITFGISEFKKNDKIDECIRKSDEALYRGKEQGRNQVVVAGE